MTGSDFRRARDLFVAALAMSPADRERFLDEECGGDSGLRAEVEELLGFHEQPTGPDLLSLTPSGVAPAEPEPPPEIRGYRILRRVGAGGMGEVYEARQEAPLRRRVALKVIRWGMDTERVVRRFENERQVLALMEHPNIARVFDAGATDGGRPFFAMEFVEGAPITDYCDASRLTPADRIELFLQVCHGVQHAHRRGIIHRDLKPSNIMVSEHDGRPLAKIIDFGVAKATARRWTERTVFTELGQWIGTPDYMSPEQTEPAGLGVDTRSDVYSLGVILYELLTGALPFDSDELRRSGFDEMRRRIREDDPLRPSTRVSTLGDEVTDAAERRGTDPATLNRMLRGDLDWIVMKALEKDPERRYGSPTELAADLERHLDHRPVLASPPRVTYRVAKLVRRHRRTVIAASLVVLALLAGFAGTVTGLVRARHEAEAARRVANFMVGMYADLNPNVARGQVATPEAILDRAVDRVESELADEPLVRARLLAILGHVYKELGRYERARGLLESSIELRRGILGEAHPDYAMSISYLGDLFSRMGEHEAARRLHEQALAIRREALGPDHPTVGWSLRSLGAAYQSLGDYPKARVSYGRSLEILERAVGESSYDVSISLCSLAELEGDAGRLETARGLMERCLAIRERILDPRHPQLAVCLRNVALLRLRLGELARSLDPAEKALAIHESVFGPMHFETAASLALVAVLRHRLGDPLEARRLLDRVREIDRRTGQPILATLRAYPEFAALEELPATHRPPSHAD